MSVSVGDRTLPVARGGAAGIGAAVLGYLVTYLWQRDEAREMMRGFNVFIEFFGAEPIPAWKTVGWLFYNAHFVAVTHPALGGGRASRNFIASGVAPALLYAVPVVILVGVAAAVAYTAGADTLTAGGLAGSTITVGYLPLALLGVLFFRVTRGDATITVDPVAGILLAGTVYPLVGGAAGGVLGSVFVADDEGL